MSVTDKKTSLWLRASFDFRGQHFLCYDVRLLASWALLSSSETLSKEGGSSLRHHTNRDWPHGPHLPYPLTAREFFV